MSEVLLILDFSYIIQQMLSLFLMMAVGYIMYRVHILDDAANVRFTKLVLNISLPAQILSSFLGSSGIISKGDVFNMLLLSVAIYFIYGIIGFIFVHALRVPKKEKGTYIFMMMFGNVGFMGFPVIDAIFGSEYLIYAVIFNVPFYLLVFSIGIRMMSGGTGKFNPRLLLNIPLISAVLSIILFFLGFKMPELLMNTLDTLGNVTTPVAMILLGATIASMPFRELFDSWRIYAYTAVKLIVLPAVIFLLLEGLTSLGASVVAVFAVLSGMPTATNTTMVSIEYGGDQKLAAKGIFFTTLLSMVTIPVLTLLLS